MAFDYTGYLDFDMPANGDLSADQYLFVTINSSGNVAVGAAGNAVYGVLQNAPAAATRPAKVRPAGVSRVIYGGSVTVGDNLVSDANGKAVTAASSDNYVMGVALATGVTNDVGTMLVQNVGRVNASQ